MFKILKEIFKTGNATVGYPATPIEPIPNTRGKPEHNAEACIACGACAQVCPPDAIRMESDLNAGTITLSVDYARCIFCGRCEEVCPTQAMKLGTEFELAVMDRHDLLDESTYNLATCMMCGKYYAPRKSVEYARRILELNAQNAEAGPAARMLDICPKCKRELDAQAAQSRFDV